MQRRQGKKKKKNILDRLKENSKIVELNALKSITVKINWVNLWFKDIQCWVWLKARKNDILLTRDIF